MAELAATAASSSTTSAALTKSGAAPMPRPVARDISQVNICNGQVAKINDHVYLTPSWAPGAGEPYVIARVMEFVRASSSRAGAAAHASSEGTLQVRVNVFSRQRETNQRALSDPRLLVATMQTEVYSIENIRGLCYVRHRDLIGDAPAVSAWKRQDDHFYYYQLHSRFLTRTYDVIPTSRVRNAPGDVLATLRQRYSFVFAEIGLAVDLCGPVRACAVCEQWAAGAESVRCDTCKQFFHMGCLTPPLAAKPAKGYSWTCAPCSRQREQERNGGSYHIGSNAVLNGNNGASSSTLPSEAGVSRLPGNQGSLRVGPGTRGRGRGRGGWQGGRRPHLSSDDRSASMSRESTPQPGVMSFEQRTVADTKGVRCFQCWPYRYFGEHTVARETLDPDDSIYPRATPRLGVKFQINPITWEEQKGLGLGVHAKAAPTPTESLAASIDDQPVKVKRPPGRPPKKKKEEPPPTAVSTPTLPSHVLPVEGANGTTNAPMSAEGTPEAQIVIQDREPERGTDSSVEVLYRPGHPPAKVVDRYIPICQRVHPDFKNHVGLLSHSLRLLSRCNGDGQKALADFTNSTLDDLEIPTWTTRELKALDVALNDKVHKGADLRVLKKDIPTKTPGAIVRQMYQWKHDKLKIQFEEARQKASIQAERDGQSAPAEQSTRKVSPSESVWGDDIDMPASALATGEDNAPHVCKMCATTTTDRWYKGPVSFHNRRLCSSCGIYWRKYAAEVPTEIVTRKREAAAEEGSLVQAPPAKVSRLSRAGSMKGTPGVATPPPSAAPVRRKPTNPCVMCKSKEPATSLKQCQQCSLCVHQGCYGLVNGEMAADSWLCDACANERTLDAALVPRCVLCPKPPSLPIAPPADALEAPRPRKPGRPPKNPPPQVPADPVIAAAAAKYKEVVTAPLTNLHAFKPTESNNWVHLDCALYMPELVFSEPSRMRLVEGASVLPKWRYEAVCDLCEMQEGACVSCAEPSCKRTFHVSCASQQKRFTMGIDVTPVKGSRRDTVPVARFGKQSGHMSAVIYCDAHGEAAAARDLIAMSELDKDCEPIAAMGESLATPDADGRSEPVANDAGPDGVNPPISAAQLFAVTHKGVRNAVQGPEMVAQALSDMSMHSTLRRAKRFDIVLGSALCANVPITAASSGRRAVSGRRSSAASRRASSTLEREEDFKGSTATKHVNGLVAGSTHANGAKSMSANGSQAQARPFCVRCSTGFSPYWWDVPADVEEAGNDMVGNGQPAAEDAMNIDYQRTVPAWLEAYRKSLTAQHAANGRTNADVATSLSPQQANGTQKKAALCVRCRHAVRPPIEA